MTPGQGTSLQDVVARGGTFGVVHSSVPGSTFRAMKKTLLLLLAPLSLGASEFPVPYNSEPEKSEPMSATEAAGKLRLPPGFKATVFAAEPLMTNPPQECQRSTWSRESS